LATLVLFKNYNNYFNRIIKHDVNFSDYMGYTHEEKELINFNPNDGVTTEHIINWDKSWEPDYMLVTDSEHNILSRWFVIDSSRTRKNQYKIRLKRDSLADNYDKVINAPMVVERAMVNNVNNPLLYNTEGFSFNQIKQAEQLIKDGTNSAWYILYFKKGLAAKTIKVNPKPGIEDHTIGVPIAQSIFGTDGHLYDTSNIVPMVTYASEWNWRWTIGESHIERRMAIEKDNNFDFYTTNGASYSHEHIWFDDDESDVKSWLKDAFADQYNTLKTNVLTDNNFTQVTPAQSRFLSWDNTLVKDSNNQIWRVHVTARPYSRWKYVTSGDMVNNMKTWIAATPLTRTGDWGDNAFAVKYDNIEYSFWYDDEPVADPTNFEISIDWSAGTQTPNSDYNIIAIPYNSVPVKIGQNTVTLIDSWSKVLLQAIMGTYTNVGELVDIQLLPFFPIVKGQHYPIENLLSDEYTVVADHAQTNKGIGIFYISNANFTFDYTGFGTLLNSSEDPIERKVQNETQMVRLCSPNYNGVFEFNVAKNGGVNYLNIDITLKPYNPYIHINPNFKNLYGQDFDDAKGLICGGDFSIPIWSTAWQQYQLNNKNYLNIFDRQIQNMEFTQGQERTQEMWNVISGALHGASSAASSGGLVAGAGGAFGGYIAGLATSYTAGLVDYSMLTKRQAEQINLSRDMFKYQLGNIKALPYTLNKVTPLTYNNKIFPFIEIYDCKDEEKDLFRNFLTYQSMTVQAVGTVAQYQQAERTFIKGQVIRLEDLDTESHTLYDIYDELNKGVFI